MYTLGARELTMEPEAQHHGLGMPERAIMVPPSLGMVFKGWGMEEQELLPCPFLQIGVELGWFERSSELSLSTRINPKDGVQVKARSLPSLGQWTLLPPIAHGGSY